ncbi:hypothetical protein ACFFV7_41595 [Nonomuraea spiralis]|uniref:Uncharacterized protein n=1 Tax=Nonomuraea spiralis TaxID=46182 RepID=A0ABV5IT63_9ACTN|nr:hypothetical protein [Nonomuraea spiralis]GGT41090.1 hypothetical protein GCM10010176_101050 [Nonomuraea spiralis]
MSDPYRIDTYERAAHSPRTRPRRSASRPLLWIMAVGGASVNVAANIVMRGDLTALGLASGVVGVAGIAGLLILRFAGGRS